MSDGKTPCERRFGIPFNGPVIPFGALVECHSSSAKDLSRLHQFGPQVLPGKKALHAVRNRKGDIMVADIEEMEEMDASELHARRLHANEVFKRTNMVNIFIPDRRWKRKIIWRSQVLRTSTLIKDHRERREEREVCRGESDGLSPPTPLPEDSTRDDAEAKNDFWSITGDLMYRHHVEPRVKLYMPKEESFPLPLKYIDVTRTTHTSLDVLLEKHVDDITGTWMEKENCQMHGQASQDVFY